MLNDVEDSRWRRVDRGLIDAREINDRSFHSFQMQKMQRPSLLIQSSWSDLLFLSIELELDKVKSDIEEI